MKVQIVNTKKDYARNTHFDYEEREFIDPNADDVIRYIDWVIMEKFGEAGPNVNWSVSFDRAEIPVVKELLRKRPDLFPDLNKHLQGELNVNEEDDIDEKVATWHQRMQRFLKEKNKRYGNSVMQSLQIFSKHVSTDRPQHENAILVRLDDKLKRIQNATSLRVNDVVDLYGYLTFLCISLGVDEKRLMEMMD